MREIDKLREILAKQVEDPENWPPLKPEVEPSRTVEGGLNLVIRSVQVGFAFDETGEKLLGVFNWKE